MHIVQHILQTKMHERTILKIIISHLSAWLFHTKPCLLYTSDAADE